MLVSCLYIARSFWHIDIFPMATFLTTKGIAFYIEQIIINSKQSLTLVTPYLKLSKTFVERLLDADKKGVKITLIYGKNDLADKEREKLFTLNNLQIYFCENLHAKCYHNEDSLIITSMNLYEYSEINNREMGIFIEKAKDESIFHDTTAEIESIKNNSLLEKSFMGEQEEQIPSFSIEPGYTDSDTFHLPGLFDLLVTKFPQYDMEFDGFITVWDFPFRGITMEVSYKIELFFERYVDNDSIERDKAEIFDRDLPGIRFFWNRNKLGIYTEKGFEPEVNQEELRKVILKYYHIIKTVYNQLT